MENSQRAAMTRARSWRSLPIVWHLRLSSGLQRGMLIAGLVLVGVFLLAAALAPLIAPYSYNQLSGPGGASPGMRPRPPSSSGGPRWAATTSSPGWSGALGPPC